MRGSLGPWGAVPLELVKDIRLTRNDIAVYTALSYRRGNNETMWASVQTLSNDTGIARHNVHRHLNKLKNCGWIIAGDKDGRAGTRHYAVLMPVNYTDEGVSRLRQGSLKAETGGSLKAETGGVSRLRHKENMKTKIKENTYEQQDNFAELDAIIYGPKQEANRES